VVKVKVKGLKEQERLRVMDEALASDKDIPFAFRVPAYPGFCFI